MLFILIIIIFIITAIILLWCYKKKEIKRIIFGGSLDSGYLCDALNAHAKKGERLEYNIVSSDENINSVEYDLSESDYNEDLNKKNLGIIEGENSSTTPDTIKLGGYTRNKLANRARKIHKIRKNNKADVEIFTKNAFPTLQSKQITGKWSQYTTWNTLRKHKSALQSYMQDKVTILSNPDLDWSKVLSFVVPKLHDNYEHIGLVNIENDNKTMYVSEIYKSDIKIGTIDSETTFASISSKLVEQVGKIPALFMFHTHPASVEACPLPSSQDLSTSIYYATNGHYASSMIISRYGIILYGINDDMMKYFYRHNKRDFELARANYTHDVVAAHESMRSWGAHTLQDYINFYERYRMFLYIYPSSEFVAQHKSRTFDLLSPIDHEVIEIHKHDIDNIKNSKSFRFLTKRKHTVV